MNIDELDVEILLLFLKEPTQYRTVVDVVKTVLSPQTRTDLTNGVSKITYRLSKWVEQNIFKTKIKGNVRYYCLKKNKVFYGDSKLIIGDYSIEAGKAIALQAKKDNYLSVCFFKPNTV